MGIISSWTLIINEKETERWRENIFYDYYMRR